MTSAWLAISLVILGGCCATPDDGKCIEYATATACAACCTSKCERAVVEDRRSVWKCCR